MTDFGSIYSLANHPTSPAPDLMQAQHNMLSLQALGQQVQQGQMQNQQMQQQLQDAQELRDTIKQASSAGQNPVQAVSKLGSPTAQKWLQTYTEMAQSQTKLSKEQFDLAQAHLSKVGGDVIAASQAQGATPQQVAQVITNHVQQGNIPPSQAQQLIQSLPADASQLPNWGMAQVATLGASKDLLGLFTPSVHMVDTGNATQPVAINATQGTVKNLGAPIDKDIPPGDLKKFASDIGAIKDDGSVDMDNAQVKAHLRKMNYIAPNVLTMVQPYVNPGSAGGSGPDLSKLPPQTAALVKSLGEYRTLPSQVSNPRQREQLMSLVVQAYPNYNVADAEANQKFIKGLASSDAASPGGVVAASERLLGHTGSILQASDKIGGANGMFGTLWDKTGGRLKGVGNPDVAQFELEKGKIMGELNKLATGGVPHAEELASDIKNLQWTDPPEVRNRVLYAAAQLGLEQTRAVELKRSNLLGSNAPQTSLLSARAQTVLQDLAKRNGDNLELAPPSTGGYTNTAIGTPNMGGGAPKSALTNPQWTGQAPAGNPDMTTMGKNPRFPTAVWVGRGAPSGGGWYVKDNGMIRRVE